MNWKSSTLITVLCLLPVLSAVAIGPEHSGSWYWDEQSGHGFSIEIGELPDGSPLGVAYWYTYDDQGNPIFMLGTGIPDGDILSHMLVIGGANNYTSDSHGGMVVGSWNETSAPFASVSGGNSNTASGEASSVSGGGWNTASGDLASISGGVQNGASGEVSSVSGGELNSATGQFSSISGGDSNTASGHAASVSGGDGRTASGDYDWAAGSLWQNW
jgi:hypothetical protein